MKAADAQGAALDAAESRFLEQGEDLVWIDVTMAMKVREETRLPLRVREVNDKHTALRVEHAAHFSGTLLAHLAR